MARFYQTSDRNFVDDFIYEPPMEMAMAALAKKDQQVQGDLDTMEVLRSLPVDYWKGMDDERATQVRNEWEKKVNDLSQEISGNMLDPSSRAKIMALKADLNKSMTSGDIFKLQENANSYKNFEARRQSLKNPADRDMYLKQIENYRKNNPEGAYSGIFKPDEMYDTVNRWEQYVSSDSFKQMNPDIEEVIKDKTNGAYMVKTSTGIKKLSESKIGENFKTWLEGQSDLPNYAKNKQLYNNEQWLDENGKISFNEGTMAGNMLIDGVKSLAYSETKTGVEKEMDNVWKAKTDRDHDIKKMLMEEQFRQRAERAAAVAARQQEFNDYNPIVNKNRLMGFTYNYTKEGAQRSFEYRDYIRGLGKTSNLSPQERALAVKNPVEFVKKIMDLPNHPLHNQIAQANAIYAREAGTSKLAAMGLSQQTLDKVSSILNDKGTASTLQPLPGYLDIGQTQAKNVKKLKLADYRGKTLVIGNKRVRVLDANIEPGVHYLDPDPHPEPRKRKNFISSTAILKLQPLTDKGASTGQPYEEKYDFNQVGPEVDAILKIQY